MMDAAHNVIHTPDSPPIFAGAFRHAVDNKNRVTIPSRWRRGEADEFFLTVHQSRRFLVAFPPGEFEKAGRDISNNTAFPPVQRREFLRLFSSSAQHCVMDRQGRLVLPVDLCKVAGLSTEVVLLGNMTRFEVWPPDAWDSDKTRAEQGFASIADSIGL